MSFDKRAESNPYKAEVLNEYLGMYPTVEEAEEVAQHGYEYMAYMRNSGYARAVA